MNELIELNKYRETDSGTEILVMVPNRKLGDMLSRKCIRHAEIRFDDGRHISAEQRKKAYATIRDIADYTGYLPEEQKEWLKYLHISHTGDEYFSLSSCSMDTAREFINTILEYAIEQGVPLSENAIDRTDDIGRYLYFCLCHKKCAVCGRPGEIHHEDAIGMGNDRKTLDDSNHKKICLCRIHHTIAHERGVESFRKMYKVYGIIFTEGKNDKIHDSGSTGNKEEPPANCNGEGKTEGDSKQAVQAL
ncbi:MAG: putative HNHc nuclease [Lachnospiraceae bacterium]|nr:putative HNHc nuclease [Lachnospiraceae bacterium]